MTNNIIELKIKPPAIANDNHTHQSRLWAKEILEDFVKFMRGNNA